MSDDDVRFAGHVGRECGEHRTLGRRAWCHECSQYCAPSTPCRGCELPQVEAERDRLRAVVMALRTYIRWYRETGDDEDEQQAFAAYAQEGLDMAVRLTEALDVSRDMGGSEDGA